MININVFEETSLPHKHIKLLGKEIHIYRQVSSTNSIARQMAISGAAEGTIVMSKSQLSGKGRLQRQWVCPPGQGLLMSMVLRPEINLPFVPQLTLLGAVVIAETIKKVTGCSAGIKWPNDILINDKKVCGILAESSFSGRRAEFVILGFGINVNLDTNQLPTDCQATSTSLSLELGRHVSRIKVLEQFIVSWEEHYREFAKAGHPYLRRNWIEHNVTLGRNLTIQKDKDSIHGVAIDISGNGGLIVKLADGSLAEFLAEDVSLSKKDTCLVTGK